MRYSHEVDFSAGGASIPLSQRYARYESLLSKMEKKFHYPSANPEALGIGAADGGHYFTFDMQKNKEAEGSLFNGVPNR